MKKELILNLNVEDFSSNKLDISINGNKAAIIPLKDADYDINVCNSPKVTNKGKISFKDYIGRRLNVKRNQVADIYSIIKNGITMTAIKVRFPNTVTYYYCPIKMFDFIKLYL